MGSRELLGKSAGAGFDLPLAQAVYDWVMASDLAEAAEVVKAAGFELLAQDIDECKPWLQPGLEEWVAKRAEVVKSAAAGSIPASGDVPEATADALVAAVLLSKAGPDDWERAQNAKMQWRDARGRWRTMNRQIDTTGPAINDVDALRLNIPREPASETGLGSKLSDEQIQHYRQAYQQVARTLQDAQRTGAVAGQTYLWELPGEDDLREVTTGGIDPEVDAEVVARGGRLRGVQVHINPDLNLQGAAVDVLAGMGMEPGRAIGATAGAVRGSDAFSQVLNAYEPIPRRSPANAPRQESYKRLASTSSAIQTTLGPVLPTQAKLALKAGEMAGNHGPKAEKILGPHVERAAFRRRGTEKTPPKQLQTVLDSMLDNTKVTSHGKPVTPGIVAAAGRYKFLMGEKKDTPAKGFMVGDQQFAYSPVRDHLKKLLPAQELVALHTEAGRHTPSQGILINGQGRIVSEAVGFGEDWYLPFTARRLRQLDGGEYARTRVWGGPTPEDLRTSMVNGARAFTVVSHHGTYTVEFADDFRGTRRFNDKTARMVDTYRKLLDAVRSEAAARGGSTIPPERMWELQADADRAAGANLDLYETTLKRLKAEEERSPKLDAVRLAELDEQMAQEAALKMGKASLTVVEARDEAMKRLARKQYGTAQALDDPRVREAAQMATADPESLWRELGVGSSYLRAKRDALKSRRTSASTYTLDGEGYEAALNALYEQFPYYLKRPEFRPWGDSPPPAKDVGGYVRPGDTRPVAAQIGFYDAPNAKVGSEGKTSAAGRYGRMSSGTPRRKGPGGAQAEPETPTGPDEGAAAPKPLRNDRHLNEGIIATRQAIEAAVPPEQVAQLRQELPALFHPDPHSLPAQQQAQYWVRLQDEAERVLGGLEQSPNATPDAIAAVRQLVFDVQAKAARAGVPEGAKTDPAKLRAAVAQRGAGAELWDDKAINTMIAGDERVQGTPAYQPGATPEDVAAEWQIQLSELAGLQGKVGDGVLPPAPGGDVTPLVRELGRAIADTQGKRFQDPAAQEAADAEGEVLLRQFLAAARLHRLNQAATQAAPAGPAWPKVPEQPAQEGPGQVGQAQPSNTAVEEEEAVRRGAAMLGQTQVVPPRGPREMTVDLARRGIAWKDLADEDQKVVLQAMAEAHRSGDMAFVREMKRVFGDVYNGPRQVEGFQKSARLRRLVRV